MVKLSQLIPSDIRKTIPVYFNDNGEVIEEHITIFNPTKEQIQQMTQEIENEESQEQILLTLIKYCTDIEIDNNNLEDFKKFLNKFNEVNMALQLELNELWTEIGIAGIEAMEKFASLPEDKIAKHIYLNPQMAEVYEKIKEVQEEVVEIEPSSTLSEQEQAVLKQAEEIMSKLQKD